LSDVVQQAGGIGDIDVEPGAARHFLRADRHAQAVQPQAAGVERRRGTEAIDDGSGQRDVAHPADAEQHDRLTHRIHPPGGAERAGIGCRQQARHHRRVADDVAAQRFDVDFLVAQHRQDAGHDLRQGRQRIGTGQNLV
jgi:hypothetical protein